MKKIMKQAQACGSRAKPYAIGFWAIQVQESQYNLYMYELFWTRTTVNTLITPTKTENIDVTLKKFKLYQVKLIYNRLL